MNAYTMQTTYLLVVFAIVVQQTLAGTFPESIKKCKVSDSKFDECVLKSANDFLPTVINGDEKSGIPPLLALNKTRVYNFTENFGIKFSNLSVHVKAVVITDIHFDFEQKTLTFAAKCPQLEVTSHYVTFKTGPGHQNEERGDVNVIYSDVQLNGTVTLDFKTKDNKKYLEAVSSKLIVDCESYGLRLRRQEPIHEDVPMTVKEIKEHQSHITKIPELLESDIQKLDKEPAEALNKIFDLLPFDELFLP